MVKEIISEKLEHKVQVVITGMHGAGKSYMIKDFVGDYDMFRSGWYISRYLNEDFVSNYHIFDRWNPIDRYVFDYRDDDDSATLEYVGDQVDRYFHNACLVFRLDDKWLNSKGEAENIVVDRNLFYHRYLDIVEMLYRRNIGSTLLVDTSLGFFSSEYCTDKKFHERIEELRDECSRHEKVNYSSTELL